MRFHFSKLFAEASKLSVGTGRSPRSHILAHLAWKKIDMKVVNLPLPLIKQQTILLICEFMFYYNTFVNSELRVVWGTDKNMIYMALIY